MSASYLYFYLDKDGAVKEERRKTEQRTENRLRREFRVLRTDILTQANARIDELNQQIEDLQLQLHVQEGEIPQEQLVLRITELEKNKKKLEAKINDYENKMREEEVRRKQHEELIKINKEEAEKKKKEGKKGSPPPKKIIETKKGKEEIIEPKIGKEERNEIYEKYKEIDKNFYSCIIISQDKKDKFIILDTKGFENLSNRFKDWEYDNSIGNINNKINKEKIKPGVGNIYDIDFDDNFLKNNGIVISPNPDGSTIKKYFVFGYYEPHKEKSERSIIKLSTFDVYKRMKQGFKVYIIE